MIMAKYIVVGGVAGGATAAARLRRLDEGAEIILVERGGDISFANCGLPYYVGDVIQERDNLLLQTPELMKARFNIDVRVRNEAVKIDPETHVVTVFHTKVGNLIAECSSQIVDFFETASYFIITQALFHK